MDACKTEREGVCADVEPGGGKMHKCLFKHLSELSPACRDSEFATQVQKSEDVALNPTMTKHCLIPLAVYCKDAPPGRAQLKCLVDHKYSEGVSKECKERLEEQVLKGAGRACGGGVRDRCRIDTSSLGGVSPPPARPPLPATPHRHFLPPAPSPPRVHPSPPPHTDTSCACPSLPPHTDTSCALSPPRSRSRSPKISSSSLVRRWSARPTWSSSRARRSVKQKAPRPRSAE